MTKITKKINDVKREIRTFNKKRREDRDMINGKEGRKNEKCHREVDHHKRERKVREEK